jgi:hypothetical protein
MIYADPHLEPLLGVPRESTCRGAAHGDFGNRHQHCALQQRERDTRRRGH